MRIAWTGATIGDISSGSVAALSGQLLMGLLDHGDEVDLYSTGDPSSLPACFAAHPRLTVVDQPVPWAWGRWYSRNKALAFVSSLIARGVTQVRLSLRLVRNHRRRPYDCIFQFSQTELLLLGLAADRLPPIVVQPSTTAAGEHAWHKRESKYARRHERAATHYVFRSFLALRAFVQRRQLRKVRLIVGASDAFARSIQADYGIPPERTRVVPHPVDFKYYADVPRPAPAPGEPVTLLFASRLSARKGLELVIELSHRLADLRGQVRILIMGGASMWSDYTAHLADRNPDLAQPISAVQASQMRQLYANVHGVLAPSHWEPFSLVTAEALASGLPVIASDQIGAAQGIDPEVCRTFPAGDLAAFEAAIRAIVAELREPGTVERLAQRARSEARAHFSADEIGAILHQVLEEAAGASSTALGTAPVKGRV